LASAACVPPGVGRREAVLPCTAWSSAIVSIVIAPELQAIVRLGVLGFEQLTVIESATALDAPIAEAEALVRRAPPAERGAVRTMYRRTGLDPTKRRPSSEALLRRVLKGDTLPRINSLVDVCNWCSLEFQVPYGLYDAERVRGAVTLRLGREGESYPGIRKDDVHVAGRMTLADEDGAFGNPSSDSARTRVTPATTRALLVVFAPTESTPAQVEHVLDVTSARTIRFCGGREILRTLA
jgi:DNA/RNA-binding domain of Phe-tRNA-synthetase-like protein